MKAFQFRLKTLLRLREATRDERRGKLAEAFAADEHLVDRRLACEEELRQSTAARASTGAVNVDHLLNAHRYQLLMRAEIAVIDEQRRKLAEEIERRRQALTAADRDVKVLENLREKGRGAHRAAEAAAEMKELDEIAGRGHARLELEEIA